MCTDVEDLRDKLDNAILSDTGVSNLLVRLKQSIASTREFATFIKKTAALEEEHAQSIRKVCKSTTETLQRPDLRHGSFARHYNNAIQVLDRACEQALSFVADMQRIHEQLTDLIRTAEKNRKVYKESGLRHEKVLTDAEAAADKAKTKYDTLYGDYERARTGDPKRTTFSFKSKSGPQFEEDVRQRMEIANNEYKEKLHFAKSQRQELEASVRPKTVKALKDQIFECDGALTYQQQRWTILLEGLLVAQARNIAPSPPDGSGLRECIAQINNEQDFAEYILGQKVSSGAVQQINSPETSTSTTFTSQLPSDNQTSASRSNAPNLPLFGLSLEFLLDRDGTAVPSVVYQCTQAVEQYGIDHEGIYRQSGSSSLIYKLKTLFDSNPQKDLISNDDEFFKDVNNVTGLLKLFFRELPDPLFTRAMVTEFIQAAKEDDEVLRRDSLHALINRLPDSNYATLRCLIFHLYKVSTKESLNRMSTSNIAIVFGPTLLGSDFDKMQEMGWQCRVIETIIRHTYAIFEEDS